MTEITAPQAAPKGVFELKLDWYHLTLELAAATISESRSIRVSVDDVGRALAELEGFSQNQEVVKYVLDHGLGIIPRLNDFQFANVLGSVQLLGEDCVFPDGLARSINEKEIKVRGQNWSIHKNDADPFPSDPHAHDYETGLKLDLTNGNLYRKRAFVVSITKKKLMAIRTKCVDAGFVLPPVTI
ncbi:MAG: hypothetical protein IPI72_03985 [Flavobacteriales bacterium]|nr:hypothetical protein [Flavobacteriales bacterium]